MITIITGPMFAGKSSALIARGTANKIAGKGVIAFKPTSDNRYSGYDIVTHNGDRFPSYAIKNNLWEEANEIFSRYPLEDRDIDVILIDEAQFFVKEDVLLCVNEWDEWAHVIISGLSQDSFGKPFGAMPELLAVADDIVSLKAVCSKCKNVNTATRTFRKSKEAGQVLVGGIDAYEPRCPACWMEQ